MAARLVVEGLWEIPLGFVNAFLVAADDGLTLIDTGVAGSTHAILDAVKSIGRQAEDVRRILVTHCHNDHAGSLAALKRATGASAAMHPVDAVLVRSGESMRPLTPAPGVHNALICRFLVPSGPSQIEPAEIDHEIHDGENSEITGGLQAVHAPGHCAGQLAFLWPRHGGVLIAADAAANAFGLALSPLYEDLDEGRRSLAKLAALDFETACFGHGRPIRRQAAKKFRAKWANAQDFLPV